MAEGRSTTSSSGAVLDEVRLAEAVAAGSCQLTEAATDMNTYLAGQVADASHTEVIGPLLGASGGSGVVRFAGREVASWGDPSVPEMAFSATKSVASVAAGIAYDTGLLVPEQPVREVLLIEQRGLQRPVLGGLFRDGRGAQRGQPPRPAELA